LQCVKKHALIYERGNIGMRIGFIGAGIISHTHAEAIKKIEGLTLVAAAEVLPERLKDFAEKHHVNTYIDYKEMVKSEVLDAVAISLPHYLHKESAVFCAEHGLHILLEKPMANTVEECAEILKATRQSGVVLMICHVQRYFSTNVAAKKIIDSGRLGKLVSITDVRNINYFVQSRPSWFLKKETAGGGIVMNYGVHSLDKIMFLTDSKVMHINGIIGKQMPNYDVEGHAQILLQLECGVTAVISYCGYNVPPINETILYFTEGTIKLHTGSELWVNQGDGYERIPIHSVGDQDAFAHQWQDFFQVVENGANNKNNGDYGMEIISSIEQIYNYCGFKNNIE